MNIMSVHQETVHNIGVQEISLIGVVGVKLYLLSHRCVVSIIGSITPIAARRFDIGKGRKVDVDAPAVAPGSVGMLTIPGNSDARLWADASGRASSQSI